MRGAAYESAPAAVDEHRWWWTVLSISVIVSIVAVTAVILPAVHYHYAGSDASNYTNNAFRRSYGLTTAEEFVPAEWTGIDQQAIGRAFTDARFMDAGGDGLGMMTPFVPVTGNRIQMHHDNLTARAAALALDLGSGQRAMSYLNYVFTALAVVAMFGIVRSITGSNVAAFVSATALALLPSEIMGARILLSEALAQLLWLVFAWAVIATRASWPSLILVLLVMTRPEFFVVLLAYALWVGWSRRFSLANLLALGLGSIAAGDGFLPTTGAFASLPSAALTVGAVAIGVVAGLVARGATPSTARDPEERSSAWVRWSILIALVSALLFELVRSTLDAREQLGPIEGQRFSTLGLLFGSAGVPLVVAGVTGLFLGAAMLRDRVPPVLGILCVPQLFVFVSMAASPDNQFYWTRRFHVFVYPTLCAGLGLLVACMCWQWSRTRATLAALLVGLACVVGMVPWMSRLETGSFEWRRLRAFHSSASQLPPESIVILPASSGGLKAQLPLRTVHGVWSFAVWDRAAAASVLRAAPGISSHPVLVEHAVANELGLEIVREGPLLDVDVSESEHFPLQLVEIAVPP
jgi:hypothetical protein